MSFFGSLLGQNDFHATAQNQAFGTDAGTQAAYQQALAAHQAGGTGAAPTIEGVQEGVDRTNVLGSLGGYSGLIQNASAVANGTQPGAAGALLQQATDQNNRTAMGNAASGNVSPGQRAALIGQAGNQVAQQNQVAGQAAAANRINEQNAARAQAGSLIGQQAGGYQGLLAGTQGVTAANQNSANQAQGINATTSQANANAIGGITKGLAGAAGMAMMA